MSWAMIYSHMDKPSRPTVIEAPSTPSWYALTLKTLFVDIQIPSVINATTAEAISSHIEPIMNKSARFRIRSDSGYGFKIFVGGVGVFGITGGSPAAFL